ncbi:hypothetical protein PYH37_001392 [Sinorhizobium numidicum]|uniref:Uncharacterized protein n=1 Tax=Sinorhizobium numidicum TaxID=680248 RepID=A0ABY8CSL9_9HYPH|nr:hypothetical protein [Sinorhizobium numidicum]WEX74021.1 hypothetical protein PYH37_001392 [Sinorhizobium numidicum]WEX80006.1 hypothetical protein PYH38_001393 [Sinorhizobium numidicum]
MMVSMSGIASASGWSSIEVALITVSVHSGCGKFHPKGRYSASAGYDRIVLPKDQRKMDRFILFGLAAAAGLTHGWFIELWSPFVMAT